MWPFGDDDNGDKPNAPYSNRPAPAPAPDAKPKRQYAPMDAGKNLGGMTGGAVKAIRSRRQMIDDAVDGN